MKIQTIELKKDKKIRVVQDTQYIIDVKPSRRQQYEIELIFEKPCIQATLICRNKLQKDQQLILTTISRHRAPNTRCHTSTKQVLKDSAIIKYIGKVIIEENASKTEASLEHKVLTIGQHTICESQPILEIKTNDVQATHTASISKINKKQLYYLKTRGLDRNTAESLIIESFMHI